MKLTALLAGVVLLALAPPALAIDEGVPDGDGHPNVGMLGFDVDGSGPIPAALLCTGSVLTERLFLTAAHCITFAPEGTEWVVTLEPGGPANPVVLPGIFPEDFPHPLTVPARRGGVAIVHPDFESETRAHDVAVVQFPPATFAGVAPIALPRAKQLDRLRRRGELERTRFRLAGYGADPERGDGETVFIIEGYRQTATAPFRALERRRLVLDGRSRITGQGSLCYGDSGSPQLLGNVAVSLFSEHVDDCHGPLWAQRLDTRSELEFLKRVRRLGVQAPSS